MVATRAGHPGGVSSAIRSAPLLSLLILAVALGVGATASGQRLYLETFDRVPLGPSVEERVTGPSVWTRTPPTGWTVDDRGMPGHDDPGYADNDGRREWAGWSFASIPWWQTVDHQRREEFQRGSGAAAIADPDEWDDGPHFPGLFNARLVSPAITIAGRPADSLVVSFDSSWRPECCDDGAPRFPVDDLGQPLNNQTAVLSASFDGGPPVEILRWDSRLESPDFHEDNPNERVVVPLDNPAGAQQVVLTFSLLQAANDWWWAIDNLALGEPPLVTGVIPTGTGFTVQLGEALGRTVHETAPIAVTLNGEPVSFTRSRDGDTVVLAHEGAPRIFTPGQRYSVGVAFTSTDGRSLTDRGEFVAPRYTELQPTVTGFVAGIRENDTFLQVDEARGIVLELDGVVVPVTSITRHDLIGLEPSEDLPDLIEVTYRAPEFLAGGSLHDLRLTFLTRSGQPVLEAFTFTTPEYPTLPAALATPLGTGAEPGIRWRTGQSASPWLFGTTLASAEAQLAGDFGPSVHDPAGEGSGGYFAIPHVNFEQSGSNDGHFSLLAPASQQVPDSPFPGIPGLTESADWFAGEALAYVEIPEPGVYTMAVYSDDGFMLSAGNAVDPTHIVLGLFDGARAAATSILPFRAEAAGIYLFRLLHFEGGGTAAAEWFTLDAEDRMALINGPDATGVPSLKSYRSRTVAEPTLPGATVVTLTVIDNTTGEADVGPGRWRISRAGGNSASLTVHLTVSGSAENGADYPAIAPTVTLPIGVDSVDLLLLPHDDSHFEEAETVRLTVAPGAGYSLGEPSSGEILIVDDDAPATALPGVLRLDGLNDFATRNGSVWPLGETPASYTVEAWIRPETVGAARFIAADDAFDFDFSASGVSHALYAPIGTYALVTHGAAPAVGEWSHVAITFDHTTSRMRVALNGALAPAVTSPETAVYSDLIQHLTLGARRLSPKASPEGLFHGDLDEVRISDSVRYAADFTPAARLTSDAHTRALYHFDEHPLSTSFHDSSGGGRTLWGVGGAHVVGRSGPEGPGPALAGHWRFDETHGLTAADASGHDHPGTLVHGPLWSPEGGRIQGALTFDGVNDGVVIPSAPGLELGRDNEDFTVGFWVNLHQGFTGAWRTLLHKGNNATARTPSLWLRPDSNRLYYRVSTADHPNRGGESVASLTLNRWTHVALIKAGGKLRLFLDGLLDSEVTLLTPVVHNAFPFQIGDDPWFSPFKGQLDDLRVLRRALSDLEVFDLAHRVAHWRMAEGAGQRMADASPYRNDGVLGSAPRSPAWIPGGDDGALAFDGVDDIVTVPHSPSLEIGRDNADFSVLLWIRLDQGFTGAWRTVFHKGNNLNSRTPGLFLYPNSNRLYYRVSTPTSWNSGRDSVASLPLGKWTHVAMIKQGLSLRLYLNGVLDSQMTLPSAVYHGTAPLYLGDDPWFGATRAGLDDVRIYRAAVPASLISTLVAFPVPPVVLAGNEGTAGAPGETPADPPVWQLLKAEAAPRDSGATAATPALSPQAILADGVLIVRWTCPPEAVSAAWLVETSVDLQAWRPADDAVVTVVGDDTRPFLREVRVPLGGHPHRFLRLTQIAASPSP